jgi:hypothetical protein
MRFRFFRPLHGWREFMHEIVIVVIGVLLALGGAQLIDTFHSRSEVASFRAAVDHELGRDLGVYAHIIAQRPCADRRLAELKRFLDDSSAGRIERFARPIGHPFMQTLFFSAWDNKGSAIMDQLPLDLRVQYGELYDELRNNEKVLMNDLDVWRGMAIAEQAEPLDHADRVRLRELVTRAAQVNANARPNHDYVVKLAQVLHIEPIGDPNLEHLASDASFCQPLLAQR